MPSRLLRLVLVEAGRADDLLDLARDRRRRGRPASGSGANSAGVTMLTRTSVVCADRIVATSSSNGLRWSSSQIASGYSIASRRATSRVRPFGRSRLGHRGRSARSLRSQLMGSEPADEPPATTRRLDAASALNVQRLLDDAARGRRVPSACPINSPPTSTSSSAGDAPPSDRQFSSATGRRGIAGMAIASRRNGDWTMQVVTDPQHRDGGARRDRSLDGLARRVAGDGGGRVDWWVYDADRRRRRARRRGSASRRPRAAADAPAAARPSAASEVDDTVVPPGATRRPGWRSTTGPSPATPSRAAGPSRRCTSAMRQPWFDPDGFLPARARRSAGRVLLDEASTTTPIARRDLRDRRRPRLPGPRARHAS